MFILILPWITFIILLDVNGFEPCGTDEHLKIDLSIYPEMQARMDAIEEHWEQNPNYDGHQVDFHRRLQWIPSPMIIPINFLITKSPSDPYIGYEQIISQIRVLNQDFQGLNDDKGQNGRGSVSEFAGLAGDFNIRFSLNKIKRKDTALPGFYWKGTDMKFDATGGQDSEDPEHILNFWINAFLPSNTTVLGFAQYPGVPWNIDGIVLRPEVVGSIGYDHNNEWTLKTNYDLGRIASHEIGHWLNLEHIFGDGDCTKDDGVSDTPIADGPNTGCPADGTSSCGSNDMYMNHMDYSVDSCRNMFTVGQVDRGDDLFLPGGHREKLLDYVSNPTDFTFVGYFYFINGPSAGCDNGHIPYNFVAGSFSIHLCIEYTNNPYIDVITDIYIISGGSTSITCNTGYEKIDTDLNGDASGDHVYVCYKKESQATANAIITGLGIVAFEDEYTSSIFNCFTLELITIISGNYIYLAVERYFGSNYFKGPEPLIYSQSAAYCESEGSTLASIGSISDFNDAKDICGSDNCFIGLRADLNDNSDNIDMIWSWDDGLNITKSYGFFFDGSATTGFGPWYRDEPNQHNGNDENCVKLMGNNDGEYNNVPCSDSYYPLCNKLAIRQKQYFRGRIKLNYGAASSYCRSQGAGLASIVTENEWNAASLACGSNWCWIGLRDDLNGRSDMIFEWDDGSRISNSYGFNSDETAKTGQGPWNNGEPNEYNGNEEDCVHMYQSGKYNDAPCNRNVYPLCMRF